MTDLQKVTIIIDGVEHQVDRDINLLQACLSLQMDMPYFCWHPAMGSAGSCRQCAMIQYQNPDDERGRLIMSCMTPVSEGMIVSMANEKAVDFRATAIEAIMTNHPHDCPVCEEGGDCHLQDMTLLSGHINRQYPGSKRTHLNQYLGPLLNHEMNRCIGCYRCVRFYRDYAGGDDLNVFSSRNRIYFGRAESGVLENHFAGNLAEVCPTGVFTDKTFSSHYVRKWDLATSPTICSHCSVGCNTYTSERDGKVRRVNNRHNPVLNDHFICDKGRFGYEHHHHTDRLTKPWLRPQSEDQSVTTLDNHAAHMQLIKWTSKADAVGIFSNRSSIENNAALSHLLGRENCYAAMPETQLKQLHLLLQCYQFSALKPATLNQIEQADAMLLVGEDPSHTAPRLGLSIRQMTRNAGIDKAAKLGVKKWQDEEVRNIAQDLTSPLHIINTHATALDDVATDCHLIAPFEQLELLLKIEAVLSHPQEQTLNDTNSQQNEPAHIIATALKQAKRPAIITGCANSDPAILAACIRIATLLQQTNNDSLFYCSTNEANSLAVAALNEGINDGAKKPPHALQTLLSRIEKQPPTTLVILETDLYRYFNQQQLENLFDKIKHIIVLDHLLTPSAQMADLLLPTNSLAESHGYWLNAQGRLQQSYAAKPANSNKNSHRQPAYQWLSNNNLQQLNQIRIWCAEHFPFFAAIKPSHKLNDNPFVMARQPMRSTGRTSMAANIDVKEYPPAQDNDSAMVYSMEGVPSFRQSQVGSINRDEQQSGPSSIDAPVTGVWSPKWNSSQGISKSVAGSTNTQDQKLSQNQSQSEGYSLFEHYEVKLIENLQPEAVKPPADNMTICPNHHIYADDELCHYTDALKQLLPANCAQISQSLADTLNLKAGDTLKCKGSYGSAELPCHINNVAPDVILVPAIIYRQLGDGASVINDLTAASTQGGMS